MKSQFFVGLQQISLRSLKHPHEQSISTVAWNRNASKLTHELNSFIPYNTPDKKEKQVCLSFVLFWEGGEGVWHIEE